MMVGIGVESGVGVGVEIPPTGGVEERGVGVGAIVGVEEWAGLLVDVGSGLNEDHRFFKAVKAGVTVSESDDELVNSNS